MTKNNVRIKITGKNGNRIFKIKEFPVYLGSGNAPDIIPIKSDKVEPRHGKLYVEKSGLFYEDNSNSGTKINSKLIKNEKMKLSPGINDFQIGRLRVLVENNIVAVAKGRKNKHILNYLLGLMVFIILLISGWFLYDNYISYDNVKFTNFSLTPTTLISLGENRDENRIDSLYFNKKIDAREVKYTLYFLRNNNIIDSTHINNVIRSFGIPSKLIDRDSTFQDFDIEVKPVSSAYTFTPPKIIKNYTISNEVQVETKGSFKLRTKLNGKNLEYEILTGLSKIKEIIPDFGNNIKISNMGTDKMKKLSLTYDKSGKYNFKLTIKSDKKKSTVFKRTIIIQ